MSGDSLKIRLADRTGAILRSDRQAFERANLRVTRPVLLVLVPGESDVKDLADSYIPHIAGVAGLQYVRPEPADLKHVPTRLLCRAHLILADLTEPHPDVLALIHQARVLHRRVLLMARSANCIPRDLAAIPSVLYSLQPGLFNHLLKETLRQVDCMAAVP